MSTDRPVVLASEVVETGLEFRPATGGSIGTALAVLFAAAAVLCASFLAVMIGLV